jgi:predicted ATPase
MMQLDELVLYNHRGDTRPIPLRAGQLNIITGDSRTGKSSLIGIVRFLLGSRSPNVPFGTVQQTVAWYGLHALEHNNSRAGLREYLGGLLGIEDNRNEPALGQTRHPLSASFKHSLFYCFQGQGEIANPEILFRRQNANGGLRPSATRCRTSSGRKAQTICAGARSSRNAGASCDASSSASAPRKQNAPPGLGELAHCWDPARSRSSSSGLSFDPWEAILAEIIVGDVFGPTGSTTCCATHRTPGWATDALITTG